MNRFVGKNAVVTGASAGIGEQIAKALLRRGVNVIGVARKLEKLQALSEEIASQPECYKGKFSVLTCDIAKEEDIKETFSKIKSSFGSIAILINNAAAAEPITVQMSEIDTKSFHNIFDTNVKGYCQCTNEAIKLMTDDSAGGHIVNISSLLALPHVSHDYIPLYTTSKRATRAFTDILRMTMAKEKRNIKISNVTPGLVNTDFPRNCGREVPQSPDEVLSPEDVANGCIAVLDTPPSVLVSEYSLSARFASFV